LPEVLRVELSGVPDARSWVVQSQEEWRSLWDSFPASEMGGRTLPVVDFARDRVVVVTAGNGNSGWPVLTFAGYQARGDTTEVHVRSQACFAADDILQLLIAGRVPRRDGPVRVLRHHSTTGCDE
ncbi:MAG TPA: hypothetical protein VFS20_06720, partial [Longimicrobium sp.]|nr:hypothetical protein [Longimicrobium sp.]